MNTENNIISLEEATKSRKRFVRSLEYELLASMAVKQYTENGAARFDRLLAIPLTERIPGLLADYGLKRLHRLVKLFLHEFCYGIALPKSKKLSETQIAVVACDLILVAEEDQLSLEDLIVFLEMARNGAFGRFKGLVTHYGLMQKMETFRQQRHDAFVHLKAEVEARQKAEGPQERISPEPTAIKKLFEQGSFFPLKKIG